MSYEASARWAPRRFRAEVIGFYNDYTNLMNICTFSMGCVEVNLDRQIDGGAARGFSLPRVSAPLRRAPARRGP